MKTAFVLLVCVLAPIISAKLCQKTTTVTRYRQDKSYRSCGWWGWNRCTTYNRASYTVPINETECCAGDIGHIESGCNGECPYTNPMDSAACSGRTCRDYTCDKSRFPVPANFKVDGFHENDNSAQRVLTANATCFVQYTCPDCSCTCSRTRRSAVDRNKRAAGCSCSKNVPCTSCVVSNKHLFEVRNNVEIWKRECMSQCRNCTADPGCLGAGVDLSTEVTCSGVNYDYNDERSITIGLEPPTSVKAPTLRPGNVKTVNGSASNGTVVADIDVSEDPAWGSVLNWILTGATSKNSSKTMFRLASPGGYRGMTALPHVYTKQIEVVGNVSQEPSQVYNLTVCAYTRRHDTCTNITVKFVTTVEPPMPPYCRGVGSYANITAMNTWCNMTCHHTPPYCPQSHCLCTKEPAPGYHYCSPVGIWQTVRGMEAWCDFACNDPVPEHVAKSCLPSYCACTPPVV
ncbi:uncharacterized protein LOC127882277 [Dreissena polymorpha]|nr:uncharacterized protein LOC127882277 [Dreissena polymorpha]